MENGISRAPGPALYRLSEELSALLLGPEVLALVRIVMAKSPFRQALLRAHRNEKRHPISQKFISYCIGLKNGAFQKSPAKVRKMQFRYLFDAFFDSMLRCVGAAGTGGGYVARCMR